MQLSAEATNRVLSCRVRALEASLEEKDIIIQALVAELEAKTADTATEDDGS